MGQHPVYISKENEEIAQKLLDQNKFSETINKLLYDYSRQMQKIYLKDTESKEIKSLTLSDINSLDLFAINNLKSEDIMSAINTRQDILKYIEIYRDKSPKGEVSNYETKIRYDFLCRALVVKLGLSDEELGKWIGEGYKKEVPEPEEREG